MTPEGVYEEPGMLSALFPLYAFPKDLKPSQWWGMAAWSVATKLMTRV